MSQSKHASVPKPEEVAVAKSEHQTVTEDNHCIKTYSDGIVGFQTKGMSHDEYADSMEEVESSLDLFGLFSLLNPFSSDD